jgi:shikimate kinase
VKRHLVLIGLPGSGKSTVGKLLADRVHGTFVDVDAVIVRKEGKPIPMIFAEHGEQAFRAIERREVEAALGTEPAVIAPGGGWAAQEGALAGARAGGRAFVIYLKTRADTAARRAAPEGNRPTLLGEDPLGRMRILLQERETFYKQADATVETDRKTAEQVVVEIARLAETQAGW